MTQSDALPTALRGLATTSLVSEKLKFHMHCREKYCHVLPAFFSANMIIELIL